MSSSAGGLVSLVLRSEETWISGDRLSIGNIAGSRGSRGEISSLEGSGGDAVGFGDRDSADRRSNVPLRRSFLGGRNDGEGGAFDILTECGPTLKNRRANLYVDITVVSVVDQR